MRTSHACNDSDINELLCPGPLSRVFSIPFAEFYKLAKVRFGALNECEGPSGYMEILLLLGLAGLGGAAIAPLGVCERACVAWICGYLKRVGEC